jgi:hypothetical protein
VSKFDTLWAYVKKNDDVTINLSFAEIKEILGIEIDHSFLKYKKELIEYGYEVGKISLKEKSVIFNKLANK